MTGTNGSSMNGHGTGNGHNPNAGVWGSQTNPNLGGNAGNQSPDDDDIGFTRLLYQFHGETFAREIDGKIRNRSGGVLTGNPATGFKVEYSSDTPSVGEDTWNGPAWEHPLESLETLDFTRLADDPTVNREWAVPGWIPMLETTGFAGPGGTGKTLGAQMLATSIATGKDWLGLRVNQMKAALVLCEDYPNDAYWRQNDINRKYGLRMADLDGQLLVLPRRKKQFNYLGVFDRDGQLHKTPFFHQLVDKLKKFGARFVVLDTRADIFRGNQNDEHHARIFVRHITDAIAQEIDGAVVLLYQPSRSGRSDESHESGSVQWDAAFRARLVLKKRPKGDEHDDGNGRTIERKKSNFAAAGEEILINWDDHVFEREIVVNDADQPQYERNAAYWKARGVFLKGLDVYTENKIRLSSNPGANNYAPRLILRDATVNEDCTLTELENAMHRLMNIEHVIKNVPHGRGVNATTHLEHISAVVTGTT